MPVYGDYGVLVPMMPVDIEFVYIPSPPLLQGRKRELPISRVKSHAARAAFKSRQLPKVWSEPVIRDTPIPKRLPEMKLKASPKVYPPFSSALSDSVTDQKARLRANIEQYAKFLLQKEDSQLAVCYGTSMWQWMGRGTRADPFGCVPGLSMGIRNADYAFDWLCQYVSPHVASICQPFGVSNLYGQWLLAQMAIHLDVFHAVMAAVQGGLDALTTLGGPHRSYRLMHIGMALQALQSRLDAPDAWEDDSVVLTILYLAVLEDAVGSQDASKIHRHQVQELIRVRGGVQFLRAESGIKAMIEHSPTNFAHDAPIATSDFGCLCTYPVTPLSLAYSSNFSLPAGFHALADVGMLSYQTIACIQRIASRKSFSLDRPLLSPTSGCEDGFNPFTQSSSHFVNFREGCPALTLPDDPDGQPQLERLVCLALIRYCLNCVSGERPASRCYAHNLTLDLRQQLIPHHYHATILTDTMQQKIAGSARDTTDPRKQVEREALIWIWLMAIDTWSLPNFELSNAGKILLIDLLDRFEEVRFMSEQHFDDFGRRWFWMDNINGVLKRYVCGSQRDRLLEEQKRLSELRIGYDCLVSENVEAWPKCKACHHCDDADVVVAGWRMKGSVASSAAPILPAHSI